VNNWPNLVELI